MIRESVFLIAAAVVTCRAENEGQPRRARDVRMRATGHDLHGVPLPTEEDFRQEKKGAREREQQAPTRLVLVFVLWMSSRYYLRVFLEAPRECPLGGRWTLRELRDPKPMT